MHFPLVQLHFELNDDFFFAIAHELSIAEQRTASQHTQQIRQYRACAQRLAALKRHNRRRRHVVRQQTAIDL